MSGNSLRAHALPLQADTEQTNRQAAGSAPGTRSSIPFFLADVLGLDGLSCCGSDKHKPPSSFHTLGVDLAVRLP